MTMSIKRFFLILALVIFLGMVFVYQHSQSIRAGYEINGLQAKRNRLAEENKASEYALLKMKSPRGIMQQVAAMELGLIVPGETQPPVLLARNETGAVARTD